jgi:transcriptional regulator with XRE-family HTH domain
MPTLAEMLEEAMQRKGLSQQRLAKETGFTAPWINMILRRAKAPGPEALLKLADVLGLDRRTLVRQANYERAYDPWKPYLEPAEQPEERAEDGERSEENHTPSRLAVIGTASAGAAGGDVEVAGHVSRNGEDAASEAPGQYPQALREVGFDAECKAIRVEGESLEPIAYDGQYVVISPLVRKEDIPDGSLVYLTYELPGDDHARATVKRVYRYRLAGEEPGDSSPPPVYVFVPANAHLRHKSRAPEPQEAFTLRHRQVREMYPVVGVIFDDAPQAAVRAAR